MSFYSVDNENQTVGLRVESIDTANECLQCYDKLCYLGDMTGAGARVRSGWYVQVHRVQLPRVSWKASYCHLILLVHKNLFSLVSDVGN